MQGYVQGVRGDSAGSAAAAIVACSQRLRTFRAAVHPPIHPPSLSQSMKMSCTSQASLGQGGWEVPSRVCSSECLRSMRDVVFLCHCRHGSFISRAEYRSTPSLESSTLREPQHFHGGFQCKTRMLRMALNLFVSPQHCICLRDIVDGQS